MSEVKWEYVSVFKGREGLLQQGPKGQRSQRLLSLTTKYFCCLHFCQQTFTKADFSSTRGEKCTCLWLALAAERASLTLRLCLELSPAPTVSGLGHSPWEAPQSQAENGGAVRPWGVCVWGQPPECECAILNFQCGWLRPQLRGIKPQKIRLRPYCFQSPGFGVLCYAATDNGNTPFPLWCRVSKLEKRGPLWWLVRPGRTQQACVSRVLVRAWGLRSCLRTGSIYRAAS